MKSKFSWLAAPYVLWMMVVIIVPIFMVMFYAFTTANSVELAELEGGLAGFFRCSPWRTSPGWAPIR